MQPIDEIKNNMTGILNILVGRKHWEVSQDAVRSHVLVAPGENNDQKEEFTLSEAVYVLEDAITTTMEAVEKAKELLLEYRKVQVTEAIQALKRITPPSEDYKDIVKGITEVVQSLPDISPKTKRSEQLLKENGHRSEL